MFAFSFPLRDLKKIKMYKLTSALPKQVTSREREISSRGDEKKRRKCHKRQSFSVQISHPIRRVGKLTERKVRWIQETLIDYWPFSLRARAWHQYLPHAVELSLGIAQVPGGLSAPAGEALSAMSAEIRTHRWLVVRPESLIRLVIVLAVVHSISRRVLLVRPIDEVTVVLGIDPAGHRLRQGRRRRPVPLATGSDYR